MSNGERDPWYAYPDRQEKTYTQSELDAAVAAERERWAKLEMAIQAALKQAYAYPWASGTFILTLEDALKA